MVCAVIYHDSTIGDICCVGGADCCCSPCMCERATEDPMTIEPGLSSGLPDTPLTIKYVTETTPLEPVTAKPVVEVVAEPVAVAAAGPVIVEIAPPIVFQPFTVAEPPPVVIQPVMGVTSRDYTDDPLIMALQRRLKDRCQPFDLYKFCGITK